MSECSPVSCIKFKKKNIIRINAMTHFLEASFSFSETAFSLNSSL